MSVALKLCLSSLLTGAALFSEELFIQGLSWHEAVKQRPVFQKTFSHSNLQITLDSPDGAKISVGPLPLSIFKKSSQWKTASAVVRRAPDVMTVRLILEDGAGKPILIFGKNEKLSFHPLAHYEIKAGKDLSEEKGSGRMSGSLILQPLASGQKEIALKPGESGTVRHEDGKWQLTLLSASRSLPSPAKRAWSHEEAVLLFDYFLER